MEVRNERRPTQVSSGARAGAGVPAPSMEKVISRIAHPGAAVNSGLLVLQAQANERRALALAAWHRERAGRYLAWCDSSWAAAQYDGHVREAAYQERLAARHAAVATALGAVHHG